MEIRIQGRIVNLMKMKHQVVDVIGEIHQVNQIRHEKEEVVQILGTGRDLRKA